MKSSALAKKYGSFPAILSSQESRPMTFVRPADCSGQERNDQKCHQAAQHQDRAKATCSGSKKSKARSRFRRLLRAAASARPPLDYGHSEGHSRVLYRYHGSTLSPSGPLRALTRVRPRRRVEDAEFVRERHDRRRRRRLGLRRRKENERRTEGERDSSSGRAACARRVRACVLQRVSV